MTNQQSSISRWLRKIFTVESSVVQLDVSLIADTIADIERKTRAELRVHASTTREYVDPMNAAITKFSELGMHNTAEKNGVLLWLNTRRKEFAIIGDAGIDQKVESKFWEKVKSEMLERFKLGNATAAVLHGLNRAGERLAIEFPANGFSNPNELDNTVSTD